MDIERDPKLERESGGTEQIYFDVRKGHKAFATYIFSVNNVLNFARMWNNALGLAHACNGHRALVNAYYRRVICPRPGGAMRLIHYYIMYSHRWGLRNWLIEIQRYF